MRGDLNTKRVMSAMEYIIRVNILTYLVDSIKDQFLLQNKLPERVSPVPTVISDSLVCVDFDKDVGNDQSPAKDPASNDGKDRFILRETELGAGEERVGEEVAAGTAEHESIHHVFERPRPLPCRREGLT